MIVRQLTVGILGDVAVDDGEVGDDFEKAVRSHKARLRIAGEEALPQADDELIPDLCTRLKDNTHEGARNSRLDRG